MGRQGMEYHKQLYDHREMLLSLIFNIRYIPYSHSGEYEDNSPP